MTDATYNEVQDAMADAITRAAVYRGIPLCTATIARTGQWTAHDDATVSGVGFTTAAVPSDLVKQLIDAHLDAQVPPAVPTSLIAVQASPNTPANGAGISIALAAVKKGDLISVVLQYSGAQPTWQAVASDSAENAYTEKLDVWGGAGVGDIRVFEAIAAADVEALEINVRYVGRYLGGILTAYQHRGDNLNITWLGDSFTSLQPAGAITSLPYAVQAGSQVIVAAEAYVSSGHPVIQATAPLDLTRDTDGTPWNSNLDMQAWHYPAAGDPAWKFITFSPTVDAQWRLSYVIGVVNPPSADSLPAAPTPPPDDTTPPPPDDGGTDTPPPDSTAAPEAAADVPAAVVDGRSILYHYPLDIATEALIDTIEIPGTFGGSPTTVLKIAWNFGDGTNGFGANGRHPYDAAGTYTITGSVSYKDGSLVPFGPITAVVP